MTTTTSTQPQAGAELQRRVDDMPLPDRQLDWDDGTPIEGNVVHQYHPRGERLPRWADIKTREHLLDVQAQPARFEVRTLFKVPVDDLARGPISRVAAAQERLDRIERLAGAAIANMRAAMAALGEKP
jgi:hypothetical protein